MPKCVALLSAVLSGCLLLALFPVEALPGNGRTPRVEDKWSDGIWIFSPTNTSYNSDTLLLNITAKCSFSPDYYTTQLKYSLNGVENVTISTGATFVDMSEPGSIFSGLASYTLFSGETVLAKLSQGTYRLTVYGEYNRAEGVDPKYPNMHDIQTVYFTINNGIPPSVDLLNFENTSSANNLSLNFTVNKPTSWMGYSFDGQANVTVASNFTLSQLAYGTHNITVYARDLLGNVGASETASFIVAKPEQTQFWFVIVTAAVIALVCVAVVLFLTYEQARLGKKGSLTALLSAS